MDFVFSPHLIIMKHLWWALPLLSAILGAVLGRILSGARTLAVRGAPVCLLLGMAGALVWWKDLLWVGASHGFSFLLSGILPLMLAAVMAGGAVLCAFRPTRKSCGVAALAAVLWVAYTAYGLFRKYFIGYRDLGYGYLSIGLLVLTIVGAVAVLLAFMGLFGKVATPAAASTPQQESPVPPQPAASAGCLTVLCGSFAGQQLPLPAGEELTLGGDAAQCHLILDQPGVSPCLCSLRWLEGRNTYLVSCHAPEGLLWADGSCAPSGSTTEVFPGTVCYLPATGIPVVQLG